ncbi:MAG: NUDIX domain-containing protein [Reinekea sp.]
MPIAPDGRILLCKRNIEPRKDFWTLPAGFMENGETTLEGALRETLEEAALTPESPRLISIISLPKWNQVHLFYQVSMVDYQYSTTPESNAVELFSKDDIPWQELAFLTVDKTLKHYFNCLEQGFSVLNDDIHP